MGCASSKQSTSSSAAPQNPRASSVPSKPTATTPGEQSISTANGTSVQYASLSEKYEVGEVLGQGSYSIVKLGISKKDQKKVAIKIFNRAKIKPEDEYIIHREVDIMKNLDHPNIVRLMDFINDENHIYVIMEFVGGGELFERICEKAVYTESEAREIALVMLKALKYIHDKDMVHRDIKPENILLVSKDNDIDLKIADFGFAVQLVAGGSVKQQAGTPGYVSPEVLERKPHGKPVDMWAMGVILFMLLGGYPPFYEPDNNQKNMYRRILCGDYFFHPEYWSDISNEAKDLVRGLLTVDQTKRLTVDAALAHPWFKREKQELSLVPLTKTIGALKEYRLTQSHLKSQAVFATIEAIRMLSNRTVSVSAMANGISSGNMIQDVAVDVIRKLSNTNLNSDVIEAARKRSGANIAASGSRRSSHTNSNNNNNNNNTTTTNTDAPMFDVNNIVNNGRGSPINQKRKNVI